ncbi:hypothetical protein GCM10011519_26660 [Marmoricola endophyticus]|uniref:HTH tetR-type domain-containing protein n=1 Tax=Marmoricola endophyticus TaxID=2040280 RepID=A0A917F6J3_9ACTN|nr:TetR/AcrR family transcriptional regulator [Marmoricola endophyticus]GGF51317.1 hypothetical protein GCM10011519_26660 [Marmoricola endophyticus]
MPERTTTTKAGRPRSERARSAVLHAADDLLVEIGYADLTMKAIAERAGVGRQTVYRWWATKAEVLFEATTYDAAKELASEPSGDARADVVAYLERVEVFLACSDAGAAYKALVAAAQQDAAVADLMRASDPLIDSAHAIVDALGQDTVQVPARQAVSLLVGPEVLDAFTDVGERAGAGERADAFLRAVRSPAQDPTETLRSGEQPP